MMQMRRIYEGVTYLTLPCGFAIDRRDIPEASILGGRWLGSIVERQTDLHCVGWLYRLIGQGAKRTHAQALTVSICRRDTTSCR
mgnify:CR=1 FL=1